MIGSEINSRAVFGPGDVAVGITTVGQLFGRDYPTWAFGVSVSYPIGQSAEEANYARARLESAQAVERLRTEKPFE